MTRAMYAQWDNRTARVTAALALSMLATLAAPLARGQVAGATLSGQVADESGAVVAGAKITIKNSASGTNRGVSTNAGGLYSAPNLLPGSYEVSVTAPGFTHVVQDGITLTVGARIELPFTLKVGAVSETIEVHGTPPVVQTGSSTISATVDSTTVRELPTLAVDDTAEPSAI